MSVEEKLNKLLNTVKQTARFSSNSEPRDLDEKNAADREDCKPPRKLRSFLVDFRIFQFSVFVSTLFPMSSHLYISCVTATQPFITSVLAGGRGNHS